MLSRAFLDTHLPNALALLAFVPYLSAKALREAAVVPRSLAHCLAALMRASAASRSAASALSSCALAAWETHLPYALRLLPLLPYFCSKARRDSAVVPRSVLQVAAALDRAAPSSAASSRARVETHLPNVRYLAANASRVAAVLPRS